MHPKKDLQQWKEAFAALLSYTSPQRPVRAVVSVRETVRPTAPKHSDDRAFDRSENGSKGITEQVFVALTAPSDHKCTVQCCQHQYKVEAS